jgi:hypothetical protein
VAASSMLVKLATTKKAISRVTREENGVIRLPHMLEKEFRQLSKEQEGQVIRKIRKKLILA